MASATRNYICLGYFDRKNLGDESFKVVIPKLFSENVHLTFICTDDFKGDINKYDAVICGGGDIINPYFIDRIKGIIKGYTKQIYALGVGIAHESTVENGLLDIFDHVFVRNVCDVRMVQRRLGSKYAHYLPDLGFLLEPPEVKREDERPYHKQRVCICLACPAARQPQFTKALVSFINTLTEDYHVILLPFNTDRNMNESDVILNRAIAKETVVEVIEDVTTVTQMLKLLASADYIIAHRFHSHVFSTVCGVPYLSIETCRKVKLLNKETHYTWTYTPAEKDGRFDVDTTVLLQAFDRMVSDAPTIRKQLNQVYKRFHYLYDTKQVEALLRYEEKRVPHISASSPSAIYSRSLEMASQVCGKDFLKISNVTPEQAEAIAEVLVFDVTKSPGDKYVYGTKCNLVERHKDMKAMIEWLHSDHMKELKADEHRLNLDYVTQTSFKGLHRAGWHYVVSHLQSFNTWNGVLCDTYMDRTFHWGRQGMVAHGVLPYTSPWIGFLHHTFTAGYTKFNVTALLADPLFIRSLPTCRAIICLSEYLAKQLKEALGTVVPIIRLYHPTLFVPTTFAFPNRLDEVSLVNIGAWYRNPFTIYHLISPLKKKVLRGPMMENYFMPSELVITSDKLALTRAGDAKASTTTENKWEYFLYEHIRSEFKRLPQNFSFTLNETPQVGEALAITRLREYINKCIASVEVIEKLENKAYDTLLASNVVFLHLIDCSAANTIIECIVRCTPIVVNRLPAVVEYLGVDYPLYYKEPSEVANLLTLDRIQAAHRYLQTLDKTNLMVDTFLNEIHTQVYPLLE